MILDAYRRWIVDNNKIIVLSCIRHLGLIILRIPAEYEEVVSTFFDTTPNISYDFENDAEFLELLALPGTVLYWISVTDKDSFLLGDFFTSLDEVFGVEGSVYFPNLLTDEEVMELLNAETCPICGTRFFEGSQCHKCNE